ncbi:hypothetical protein Avbf_00896 [Armadillidium vulgare]|nr:hypothetical protein Avbf_00896 [Armadillidium vulgare]
MKIKDSQDGQVGKSSQKGEANVPTKFKSVDVVELSLDKIAHSADYEEGSSSLEPEKHVHSLIIERSPFCHSDSSDSSNILCITSDENDVLMSATVKTSKKVSNENTLHIIVCWILCHITNSVDQEGKDLKGRQEKTRIYHNGKDSTSCQSNKEFVHNASPSSSKTLKIKDDSMKNKIAPSEIPSLPFPSLSKSSPASKNKEGSNSFDKFPSLPHSAKTSSSKPEDVRQAETKEKDKSCLQSEDSGGFRLTKDSDKLHIADNSSLGVEKKSSAESSNEVLSDSIINSLLKYFSKPRKEVEERSRSFSNSYDDSHSRSGEYIIHSTPRNSSNDEEFEQSRNQKASPSFEETRWFHYQGKAKKRLNFSGLKSTFSNSYLERLWNEIVDECEDSLKERKENITDMKEDSSCNICLREYAPLGFKLRKIYV